MNSPNSVFPWFRFRTGPVLVLLLSIVARLVAEEQSLSWTSPDDGAVLRVGQQYPLVASASSGLPVTFRVAAGPAVVRGETVTVTNVGTVVLIAEQEGDATFSPASLKRRVNQVAVQVTRVGGHNTPGNAYHVEVIGGRAYLSENQVGLQIIDIEDSGGPVLMGSRSIKFPGRVQLIEDLAYVISTESGFEILDVSSPATLSRVGGSELSGTAVQVVGERAFVADLEGWVRILDLTNLAAPRLVGSYPTTNAHIQDVQVMGDFAYVSAAGGVQILKVEDPAAVVEVGGYSIRGSAMETRFDGNLAFVACHSLGLQILDVDNPSKPTLVGSYSHIDRALAVQVSGRLAFVADQATGLVILDVADPTSPVRVGGFITPTGINDVKVVGNIAYLAAGSSGLIVLRIQEGVAQTLEWNRPTNGAALFPGKSSSLTASASSGLPVTYRVVAGPGEIAGGVLTTTNFGTVVVEAEQAGDATFLPVRETRAVNPVGLRMTPVGNYDTAGHSFGVKVVGNLAYVSDGEGGLIIVDVSDPTMPIRVGSFDVGDDVFTVQVVGNLAYLAADAAGLCILDISDPTAPRLLGQNSIASEAYVVYVVGDLAYVADNTNGLLIFDVSDPTDPKLKSNVNLGPAFSVETVGGLAYVAGPSLNLFDVGNSDLPSLVSRFRVSVAHDVQVVGNLAFVAKGEGLEVVDVRHPPGPWSIGSYRIPIGYGFAVHWVDNLAFIASEGGGLHVADVSQPAAPRAAGSYQSSFNWDVHVVGDLAYLADGGRGLQILRVEQRITQTLSLGLPPTLSRLDSPFELPSKTDRGLPVSYRVSGPAMILNGNEVVVTDRGWVSVRAEQAGDEHFAPLTVDQKFMALFPPLMAPPRLEEGRLLLSWTGGDGQFVILERASIWAEPRAIGNTFGRTWTVNAEDYYGRFYQVRDSQ